MGVAFMKKKWFRFIFVIFLCSFFLIAFVGAGASMITPNRPHAAVYESHEITTAKVEVVATKVKITTTTTIAEAKAAIQATAAAVTDSAPSSEETPEIKTDTAEPCINHTFGEWVTVTAPTVNDFGLKKRTCTKCGFTETGLIPKLTAENNTILIPSANIVVPFVLTDLTQSAVNAYDAVCDLSFFQTYFGKDDIMVTGHRTNTIGTLYKTTVGDDITFNLNGSLSVYSVITSEEATITADGKDYIGVNTGTAFVTSSYERQTIRIYTCYGEGRWIVIAQKKE